MTDFNTIYQKIFEEQVANLSIDRLLELHQNLVFAVLPLIKVCRLTPEGRKALEKWDEIRAK